MIKTLTLRKACFFFMLVCLFCAQGSFSNEVHAQLLKKALKAAAGGGSEEKSKKNSLPALDYDRPFPPSVMYESLLRHLWFSDGLLRLPYVSVAFLPTKDVNGKPVTYEEYGEERLHVVLKKDDGKMLFDIYYTGDQGNKLFLKFKSKTVAFVDESVKYSTGYKVGEGKYSLEFYLDDNLINIVPFEVYKLKNDDPYSTVAEREFIRGPWNEYGFLSWEAVNSDDQHPKSPNLYWNSYFLYEHKKDNFGKVLFYAEIYKNGKYLGTTGKYNRNDASSGFSEQSAEDTWSQDDYVFYMVPAEEAPNTNKIVTKSTLTDGNYQIHAYMNKQKSVYNFQVKDGKIVESGRQVRETTDKPKFIEGLNEYWYIQREGSSYMK